MKTWDESFETTVKGFHLINPNPIVERNWEEVFTQAHSEITNNIEYNCGNHGSGSDCLIEGVSYSNKTTKIKNGKLSISSYRLTKCNNNITDIINEIDVVRKNFNFYALLAREENSKEYIYKYYKIPSNFLKANDFIWEKKYRKDGKFSGWKTNVINEIYLDISESMSSQLWIHLNTETIEQYLINTVKVSRKNKTINFSTIYKMLTK